MRVKLRPRRGQSLLEAVLASFLLLFTFVVSASLFDWSLRTQVRAEKQQLATLLLDRQLELMLHWSQQPAGTSFNFERLQAVYDGDRRTVEGYPDFEVESRISAAPLFSPCSNLEEPLQALGQVPRSLADSAKDVHLKIRWDGHEAEMHARFSAPPTTFRVLSIEPRSGVTLSRDEFKEFRVELRDSQGRAVTDVFAQWEVLETSGAGTLKSGRDGRKAEFHHFVELPSGGRAYRSGRVRIAVTVRWAGKYYTTSSEDVILQ